MSDQPTGEQLDLEYRAGATLRELGRKYGITHLRAREILLEHGTPMRLPAFHNPTRDQRIMKLREKGFTLAEIAKVLKLSRQRIHQIIQKNSPKEKGNT